MFAAIVTGRYSEVLHLRIGAPACRQCARPHASVAARNGFSSVAERERTHRVAGSMRTVRVEIAVRPVASVTAHSCAFLIQQTRGQRGGQVWSRWS